MPAPSDLPITEALTDRAIAALRDAVESKQVNANNRRLQAALDYLARALPDAWGVGQFREALTMPGETAISQMARGSLNAIERQRATRSQPLPDKL